MKKTSKTADKSAAKENSGSYYLKSFFYVFAIFIVIRGFLLFWIYEKFVGIGDAGGMFFVSEVGLVIFGLISAFILLFNINRVGIFLATLVSALSVWNSYTLLHSGTQFRSTALLAISVINNFTWISVIIIILGIIAFVLRPKIKLN